MHRSTRIPAYSNHLLYEIEMLAGTARLISGSPRDSAKLEDEDRVRLHALIASRFTHARGLMRFLYPTRGARPADMAAADYLSDGATLPDEWDGFDDDLKRIDQELAHLTYERAIGQVVEWSFWPALTKALLVFVKNVSTDRVRSDFKLRALTALLNQTQLVSVTLAPRNPEQTVGSSEKSDR
jgi:hypothetical protein